MTDDMKPLVAALAMLALLVPGSTDAQEEVDAIRRFELYAGCSPVNLLAYVDIQESEIDLPRSDVETAVRSRLRGARIYQSPRGDGVLDGTEGQPLLVAGVRVVGSAFSVEVRLQKVVRDDEWSGESSYIGTWRSSRLGTHGGNPGFVLQVLARSMDRFIDEYLAVNEPACVSPPPESPMAARRRSAAFPTPGSGAGVSYARDVRFWRDESGRRRLTCCASDRPAYPL